MGHMKNLKILSMYDFGVKKYLSENTNGYIKVNNKKDAKVFENKQALKIKMTLLNKEDFFIETA